MEVIGCYPAVSTLWKNCPTEPSLYFLVGDRHVQLVYFILMVHKEQCFLIDNLS